jgi:hypothetical protein
MFEFRLRYRDIRPSELILKRHFCDCQSYPRPLTCGAQAVRQPCTLIFKFSLDYLTEIMKWTMQQVLQTV